MANVTIDVLISVYNGDIYLRSALESIQNQTFRDFRVHIVDDGSTDKTPEILKDMSGSDPRIYVHHRRVNGGIVEALKEGLAHCTAEFIARFDADDLSYPTRFERQIKLMRSRPDILAVSGIAHHIGPNGERYGTLAKFRPPEESDVLNIPAKEPYLLQPFLMVRREALLRVGGYRHLVVSEDSDLYWRLQEIGTLHNDHSYVCGEYRLNPNSISSRSIRSGRIMAISSQLAAISALRRRSQRPDLVFTPQKGAELVGHAESLEAACSAASRELSEEEARRLRFASGLKLMEMADYRPYELELSDCIFLRQAFEESHSLLIASNKHVVARSYSGSAARLASKGRWKEARELLIAGVKRAFWRRYFLRVLLPPKIHKGIRMFVHELIGLLRGT